MKVFKQLSLASLLMLPVLSFADVCPTQQQVNNAIVVSYPQGPESAAKITLGNIGQWSSNSTYAYAAAVGEVTDIKTAFYNADYETVAYQKGTIECSYFPSYSINGKRYVIANMVYTTKNWVEDPKKGNWPKAAVNKTCYGQNDVNKCPFEMVK